MVVKELMACSGSHFGITWVPRSKSALTSLTSSSLEVGETSTPDVTKLAESARCLLVPLSVGCEGFMQSFNASACGVCCCHSQSTGMFELMSFGTPIGLAFQKLRDKIRATYGRWIHSEPVMYENATPLVTSSSVVSRCD